MTSDSIPTGVVPGNWLTTLILNVQRLPNVGNVTNLVFVIKTLKVIYPMKKSIKACGNSLTTLCNMYDVCLYYSMYM